MLGAAPRRRGVRRAGRGDGDAQPVADARLLDRRHGAHRRQQPDRLHHLRSARHALDALLHRRRQDDRGADLPRERRRSGGGAVRHPARDGLPHGVQAGRRDRPGLLPPPRPQRAGRAVRDAAADVQEDRPAPGHAQALRRQARRAGRRSRPSEPDQLVTRLPPGARRRAPDLEPGAVRTSSASTRSTGRPFLGAKWTDAADTVGAAARSSSSSARGSRPSPRASSCTRRSSGCCRRAARWARGKQMLDWGMAENLAYASLLVERLRRAPLRARTPAAAPSRTATRCCTTRTARSGTPAPTCRCSNLQRGARPTSSSSTRCSRRRRCSASSTATPAPSRTSW